ncbi:MAG: GNAT family N-acetyltransferase [Corynebacterium sp.]|uniref:GNAT family N-acetyltransferase n=1 Tax=Corynebacterium sp. TaxID=1720 RepID=UPI0026DEDF1C|nr:GNAT family N-acetyltransferase [Corynebacterium sp.]MDO5668845.1 GNAT family N-acetyltransferase [Corynebacterium sp.]
MHLIAPTADLHSSWLAAAKEWGGEHQDGAAIHLARRYGLDLNDPADFARWVDALNSEFVPEGSVPATNYWMLEDGEYVGAIQLRHTLNRYALAELFGHIGYGVRPTARGRGLATRALREVLAEARALGLHRVLMCCREDNAASISVIRKCGGVLENIRHVDEFSLSHGVSVPTCRFWIETAG